mgnify:CR=1 FL=1
MSVINTLLSCNIDVVESYAGLTPEKFLNKKLLTVFVFLSLTGQLV